MIYGFLVYYGPNEKRARFPIRKSIITIGGKKTDHICLKLLQTIEQCLKLTIRQKQRQESSSSSNNGNLDYILNICTDNEPILLNNQSICRNQGDIPLEHQDIISISKVKLMLLKNNNDKQQFTSLLTIQRSKATKIRQSSKYPLINIFPTRSSWKSINGRRRCSSSKNLKKCLVLKSDRVVTQVPLINLADQTEVSSNSSYHFYTAHSNANLDAEELLSQKDSTVINGDQTPAITAASDFVQTTCLTYRNSFTTDQLPTTLQQQQSENNIHTTIFDNNQNNQSKNTNANIKIEDSINLNNNKSKKDNTSEIEYNKSKLYSMKTPPLLSSTSIKSSNLKSALKIPQSAIKLSANKKSVMFNELVEENRSEYDHQTGRLFLSQKTSKKLLSVSATSLNDNTREDFGTIKSEIKSKTMTPTSKIKKQTPTLGWTRIPMLVPIATCSSPYRRAQVQLKSPIPKNESSIKRSKTFVINNKVSTDNLIANKESTTSHDAITDGLESSSKVENTIIDAFKSNEKLQTLEFTKDLNFIKNEDQNKSQKLSPEEKFINFTECLTSKTSKDDQEIGSINSICSKIEQPNTPIADYESNVDWGIKRLLQPTTPIADYESNVDWGIKRLLQPTTLIADYESNVDWGIKRLLQPTTTMADYESNVDWGIKRLLQLTTPIADYKSNVDFSLKQLTGLKTPVADYESNIDYGIKKLQQLTTPNANYEANVSGLNYLFINDESDYLSSKNYEFETPIKVSKYKRQQTRKVLNFEEIQQEVQNRRITRSVHKAKVKLELENEVIQDLKEKPDESPKSTRNKKTSTTSRRRRKMLKDEIILQLDSDDSNKPDLDIKQFAELETVDCSDTNQQMNDFRKAARTRSRGNNRKQASTEEKFDPINMTELADEHLLDTMEESKKTKLPKSATSRKRKIGNTDESSDNKKSVVAKKTLTRRGITRKKHIEHEDKFSDLPNNQIKLTNEDNSKNDTNSRISTAATIKDLNQQKRSQRRCKVKLPNVDYSMHLDRTEDGHHQDMENGAVNIIESLYTSLTSNQSKTIMTRSRTKRR